ncbi:MAG: SpoIIE family protein phosphatase [Candidatus Cloacimonetes bacterium]|nr:SpoIIE family protein phosphatase [Candidatus Cloacimonadota bacterium]
MTNKSQEKHRILVIDDREIVLTTVCALLEKLDYSPIPAHGGRRGLDMLNSEPYDMILVDLLMPEVDGYEIIAAAKKLYPEMPVVAVSGVSVIDDVLQAIRLGAWDYILKPIMKLDMFKLVIDRSFERAALKRENREHKENLQQMNTELRESLFKLEEDEKSGRRVQNQLLPLDIKMFGSYECSRNLIPSTYLSGDFLDYFAIGEHHFGFYIADVSGHGVSSAFVTVLLKSFMYSYHKDYLDEGDDSILHPQRILHNLNQVILAQNIDKYLTMFYGVIDMRTNEMVCSNGGQYPFPIFYNGEKADFLQMKSFPIGVFDFSDYDEMTLQLPDEFALYCISDGILDTMHLDTPQEKNELLLFNTDSVDTCIDELLERLNISPDGSYPDDITFLKVKKNR